LEKIPISGTSRVTEIPEPWLQQYINQKYEHVPQQIDISKKGCLTVECDEMGSFVGLKHNKQTLSFSKKIEAHTGAIWNFIHYYNAEISPKLAITTY